MCACVADEETGVCKRSVSSCSFVRFFSQQRGAEASRSNEWLFVSEKTHQKFEANGRETQQGFVLRK